MKWQDKLKELNMGMKALQCFLIYSKLLNENSTNI